MTRIPCAHCGGQITLESYSESSGPTGSWQGFEAKCLLCSRPWRERQYISAEELIFTFGAHPEDVRRARVASLSFLWNRDAA